VNGEKGCVENERREKSPALLATTGNIDRGEKEHWNNCREVKYKGESTKNPC